MDRSCKCGSVVGSEALHEELEISNRPAGEYLFQGTLRTVNYIRGFNVEFFIANSVFPEYAPPVISVIIPPEFLLR